MEDVLDHMKDHDGVPPPSFTSWQEDVFLGQEEKALQTVSTDSLQTLQSQVRNLGQDHLDVSGTRVVIVEGFLLYHLPSIRERLDIRIFFRLGHKLAKERRFTRPGYGSEAKPNKFWKTEDYFEKMVWRNYVTQNGVLFKHGDVEEEVDQAKRQRLGVLVMPGIDVPVDESLTWTIQQLVLVLEP